MTFDEESGIDEEADLNGNVIGNIFFNISSGNGGYDAVEGCITVTKPTQDEELQQLEGQDIFVEDFKRQFTGIVFKVPVERSPLRPFGPESKSARKKSKSNAKLIYRTHLK